LDGFKQVRGLDFFSVREVCDCARDFQNGIKGAAGEAAFLHRLLLQVAEGGVDLAKRPTTTVSNSLAAR